MKTVLAALVVTALLEISAAAQEEPQAPTSPPLTVKDPELSKKLGLAENWKAEKGKWSQERSAAGGPGTARTFEIDGIRGAGDSIARFSEQIHPNFRMEFTLNVVDGMRPRMHFDGCGFFFGNEGFEKHLYVYGDGAREVKGQKIAYENGRPMVIRIEMWGSDFAFWVDGKICAVGKRKEPGEGIKLAFRGGDHWSAGTCTWSKFSVSFKP